MFAIAEKKTSGLATRANASELRKRSVNLANGNGSAYEASNGVTLQSERNDEAQWVKGSSSQAYKACYQPPEPSRLRRLFENDSGGSVRAILSTYVDRGNLHYSEVLLSYGCSQPFGGNCGRCCGRHKGEGYHLIQDKIDRTGSLVLFKSMAVDHSCQVAEQTASRWVVVRKSVHGRRRRECIGRGRGLGEVTTANGTGSAGGLWAMDLYALAKILRKDTPGSRALLSVNTCR
ncbi:hypothetical protein FRC09_002039 [Ceratobasidium sp. 395]|nr:hypothetical protein FRC09_002039 [Ceratobasidium sp. 395]